jgi:hypothetical protein
MKKKAIILLFSIFPICCKTDKGQIEKPPGIKRHNVTLIDIEGLDKAGVGNLLVRIKHCNPKIVGINKIFETIEYNVGDSILANAIKLLGNVILVEGTDGRSVFGSSKSFTKHCLDSGLMGFSYDEDGVYHKLTIPIGNKMHWSFAFTLAANFKGGLASDIMTRYLPNTYYDTDLKIKSEAFDIITDKNFESSDCQKLTGRIVLLGDLGISDRITVINKKFNEPTTLIIAIIIESIINDDLVESKDLEIE